MALAPTLKQFSPKPSIRFLPPANLIYDFEFINLKIAIVFNISFWLKLSIFCRGVPFTGVNTLTGIDSISKICIGIILQA